MGSLAKKQHEKRKLVGRLAKGTQHERENRLWRVRKVQHSLRKQIEGWGDSVIGREDLAPGQVDLV